MPNRCDESCSFPCARDHRTKREKAQALFDGATTPGERAAAQAALDKLPEDPAEVRDYRPDPGFDTRPRRPYTSAETAGFSARGMCPHGFFNRAECQTCTPVAYRPPAGDEAGPAGRQGSYRRWKGPLNGESWRQAYWASWEDIWQRNRQEADEAAREKLRQAQARERLRREGFTMPGDPGFESEYTARASDASEWMRRARESVYEDRQALMDELRDRLRNMSDEEFRNFINRTIPKEE